MLKLATLPTAVNPAALIVELGLAGRLELWASPAILEEYVEVVREHADFLQRLVQRLEVCYPLTELEVIRHKPDNRFLECALAVKAHYLITINTARGHFDQKEYQGVRVVTPSQFLMQREVVVLVKEWIATQG